MIDIDLKTVVGRMPAMVYVYAVNHDTGESTFPFVSEQCENMLGYTAQSCMDNPKMLVNAIPEEQAQVYAAAVMESMEHLTEFDQVSKLRRADGTVLDVHFKSMPRKQGSWTVWDGVVFDITQQTNNLQTNQNQLLQAMEKSVQPVFEIDTRGKIVEWNDAMVQLTDYVRDEMVGNAIVSYMPQEERGTFATNHLQKQELDFVLFKKSSTSSSSNKRLMYLHATSTPNRNANFVPTGWVLTCQDVTIAKEAQHEKDAALKLVDAERGLTEWLSHEVRNPLSVAMEAAVALQEDVMTLEENASYSELICESIRYIVDLLTNMLDLNKCLEGKIALYPKQCRLRQEVLGPTCKMMAVGKQTVDLILEEGDEVVAALDRLRLRQVVTNLVANALKFTSEGWVRVELFVHDSTKVRILISDSGCGIDPGDYNILFSKWEQLGSQINGAGIGLCLSKSLVKAMGGDLFLNKEYHSGYKQYRGAQFIVELPLSNIAAEVKEDTQVMPAFESLSAAVLASQSTKRRSSLTSLEANKPLSDTKRQKTKSISKDSAVLVRGHFKILIVDDDPIGRRLLKHRFARLFPEATIDAVESGESALREAELRTYDLITVDHFMAMDELTGEQTIRALREKHADACIVGISGNPRREQHLNAGAQEFFQKPIPKDDVLMERLITKISPPSGWKVLCVDDVDLNVRFLCRRLRKISAPFFTCMDEAKKRWDITSRSNGEDAMELLKKEWFDLVILDQNLGDGVTGSTVASFIRQHAVNNQAVIVLNSGSMMRHDLDAKRQQEEEVDTPYNISWPKPLPPTEQMRLDLCKILLGPKK